MALEEEKEDTGVDGSVPEGEALWRAGECEFFMQIPIMYVRWILYFFMGCYEFYGENISDEQFCWWYFTLLFLPENRIMLWEFSRCMSGAVLYKEELDTFLKHKLVEA